VVITTTNSLSKSTGGLSSTPTSTTTTPASSQTTIGPPGSSAYPNRFWERAPGSNWNDSYFIGNGHLGGGIQGGVQTETVYLNEDSYWDGNYQNRINSKALSNMASLQNLIQNGKLNAAGTLASSDYVGTPTSCRNFDQIGSMTITMSHSNSGSSYERFLDIGTGVSGVYYVVNGVQYYREYIASNPAGVIAIRIAASQANSVSFSVSMARNGAKATASGGNSIFLSVGASGSSMGFASGVRLVSSGGTVSASGNTVSVSGANEAYIYFQSWTTFRQSNPLSKVQSDLAAVSQTYASIRAAHIADYQALFNKARLDVGASSLSQRSNPTSQRMIAFKNTNDPDIIALFYHYSRYLLIASSRSGFLPSNLQGHWNQISEPIWGSRYTININLRRLFFVPVYLVAKFVAAKLTITMAQR
jgi:alpha-L-fucosidase 2